MSLLTTAEIAEITESAKYQKSHRPWRYDGPSLFADDFADPEQTKLTDKAEAKRELHYSIFASAPTGQGGTPCDYCGKPVDAGRHNCCLACSNSRGE